MARRFLVLGLLVAISVTFPLFLIARERRLAAVGEASADGVAMSPDSLGLAALGVGMGVFTLWTLVR